MWTESVKTYHSLQPTLQQLIKATMTKLGSNALEPELYFTINEHLKEGK